MKFKNPEGIYIHVPFCESKCDYCSFYSIVNLKKNLMSSYIDRVIKEIDQITNEYKELRNNIQSIYFGGGTPSLLTINQISQIINKLQKDFHINFKNITETTIEVNPNTVTLEYLKELKKLGFNRISIGIQSFNDNLLKILGRNHNSKEATRVINDAIEAGFTNISCDLIFAIPGQTKEDLIHDIDMLTSFEEIKHISIYSLTVEEGTKIAYKVKTNKLELMDEDIEREMYYLINSYLEENGFNQYEISNYSKRGYESKQNSLYWNMGSYYGFGPAASYFLNGVRIDNVKNINKYLNQDQITDYKSQLTIQEAKEEFIFLGLRRKKGINNKEYYKLFNSSFYDDFKEPIKRLIESDFLIDNNPILKLSEKGFDFADYVALEFIK